MKTTYMNPYLAGFLLGLVLLTTIFITGHGLGASGAVKSIVVAAVDVAIPDHAAAAPWYKSYTDAQGGYPLKTWIFFEAIGVLAGAFLSGVVSNRLGFVNEHPPQVGNNLRLGMALIGGLLFGVGSQFARGCTSGAALSGMAVLSLGGFITMLAIFGSAYSVAWFFRKLWI